MLKSYTDKLVSCLSQLTCFQLQFHLELGLADIRGWIGGSWRNSWQQSRRWVSRYWGGGRGGWSGWRRSIWRGFENIRPIFIEYSIRGALEVISCDSVGFVGYKTLAFTHKPLVNWGLRGFWHIGLQPLVMPPIKIRGFAPWYCLVRLESKIIELWVKS